MAGSPLGIIAGRGALPGVIAEAARADNRQVIIAEMDGTPVDQTEGAERISYRVERLGALFRDLKSAGVTEIVFAGAAARPRLNPRQFDLKTAWLARKFLPALRQGDDALLRVVVGLFEDQGFAVRGAHELVPGLVAAPGVLTKAQPSNQHRSDATRGMALLQIMGAADLGQAAVIAAGQALAVEAAPGTDVMLAQVAALSPDRRPAEGQGVFVKAPKPGQERRVDLPTIGLETIEGVKAAGLAGLAIEAGGVILLDRPSVIAACDAGGLFLWARGREA